MPVVALVGTFDTKGEEYEYLRDCLSAAHIESLLIDVGVLGEPSLLADITRAEVAQAAGYSLESARDQPDRGSAISLMSRGAASIVQELVSSGRVDGLLGLGGTGGTTLITHVMRTLPVGFPKLMVSTVASGDTRPYVGTTDITMMYSIVDISGINAISRRILTNAAYAMAGMVQAPNSTRHADRLVIGATMFGLTTPAVEAARAYLEEHGYEVLVFHATGAGGASMETLVDAGLINGILDLTTTELADELVGGVFASGPTRLTAAGRAGIPQTVSLGALDMVNFGAPDTVPTTFADRNFYNHNASVTLMRTSVEESALLGARIAERLNTSPNKAEITVFVPLRGFSGIDVAGAPFFDPQADLALISALEDGLDANITLVKRDTTINDPEFAREMAATLHRTLERHNLHGV